MNKMMKKMRKNKKGMESLLDEFGGNLDNLDMGDLEKLKKQFGDKLPF
jgi:hypothetical protein